MFLKFDSKQIRQLKIWNSELNTSFWVKKTNELLIINRCLINNKNIDFEEKKGLKLGAN